jgi:RimJ/RimL family protein N-acetyltransferase
MSPNKQTVQQYMDTFARSDHAGVLACLTDDVEWIVPGAFHLHGKEEFDAEIENPAFVGNPDVLTTERLVLRRLCADDGAFIFELMNDPDWLRFIGDRGIRTADDARAWIESGPRAMYARRGFGTYAVDLRDGTPIGICGLVERDWLEDVDLGYALLPRFRGAGYAREAATAVVSYAQHDLGLPRLLAIVSPENAVSRRLLGELGFTFDRMARPSPAAEALCIYARPGPAEED